MREIGTNVVGGAKSEAVKPAWMVLCFKRSHCSTLHLNFQSCLQKSNETVTGLLLPNSTVVRCGSYIRASDAYEPSNKGDASL